MQGNFENEKDAVAELDSKGRNGKGIVGEAKVTGRPVYHDGARVEAHDDGSFSVGWSAQA